MVTKKKRGPGGLLAIAAAIVVAGTAADGRAVAGDLDQWRRLLHYQGGTSQVRSQEFFVHEDGQKDPAAELERAVHLLDSDVGGETACRFPARYLWLRENGFVEQEHDLDACEDLNRFLDRFPTGSMSLLYGSERINAPASAFGHLFLVFRDADAPLSKAQVVHFYVEAPDEPFITYALKGVFGGYTGRYERVSFPAIRKEFLVRQQRALHLYRLDLPEEQVNRIIFHLYELEGMELDYHFIRENCALGIVRLLGIAYGEPVRTGGAPYLFPVSVLNALDVHIVEKLAFEPSLSRVRRLYKGLGLEDRRALRSARKPGAPPVGEELGEGAREIISLDREYRLSRDEPVPPGYDAVDSGPFSTELPSWDPPDPREDGMGTLLAVGAKRIEDRDQGLLRFRFAGRDIYDNQFGGIEESVLTLLDVTLVRLPDSKVETERLDLFQARSILSRRVLSPPPSWSLFTGWDRSNTAGEIAFNAGFGLGASLAGERAGLALTVEAGAQDERGDGVFYLRPRMDLILYPLARVKTGAVVMKKYSETADFGEGELFLNADLGVTSVTSRVRRVGPDRVESVSLTLNIRL